jgi:hypothetical protein
LPPKGADMARRPQFLDKDFRRVTAVYNPDARFGKQPTAAARKPVRAIFLKDLASDANEPSLAVHDVRDQIHVVAAWIRNRGEREFLQITPVFGVSGIVEVFGADVGVESVGERIMKGPDMTARPVRSPPAPSRRARGVSVHRRRQDPRCGRPSQSRSSWPRLRPTRTGPPKLSFPASGSLFAALAPSESVTVSISARLCTN